MQILDARRRFLVTAVFLLALGGCASAGGSGEGSSRDADLITPEELADFQQVDAYQAVQRLRPAWLRRRGGSQPELLVDGLLVDGGVNALRNYQVSDIRQMEFMDASDATMRYGTGFTAGAILITTGR